jgi:hypothetical protein
MDIQKINNFLRPLLSGNGNGNGNGYGDGNGDGDGVSSINNQKVYILDGLQTILTSITQDSAKGFILNKDLTLEPCYIVRNNYHFSHGTTLKEALISLEVKTLLSLPINKRIEMFKNEFKDFNKKVKAFVLYDWHFKLTGSCKMGRNNFIANNNIDLQKDKFSVYEFVKLTKDQYNGEIIKKLIE